MDALAQTLPRLLGLCLFASAAASLLRRDEPVMALLLSAAAAALGTALLLRGLGELTDFARELAELTGLAPEVFAPLLKVTAVALLTRLGAALCLDAGQSALARVLEAAGALCALGCALPLLRAVINLLKGWL